MTKVLRYCKHCGGQNIVRVTEENWITLVQKWEPTREHPRYDCEDCHSRGIDTGEIELDESIIHGTHRPQDLIPAFLTVIEKLAPYYYEGIMASAFRVPPAYATENPDSEWWDSEECSQFMNEDLLEELNSHAPIGYYFGAHPGNGSDYGFWSATDES